MDYIHTWYGLPLNEVRRDVLEEEFIKAQQELERLRRVECDLRVENVRLFAKLCKEKASRRGLLSFIWG
jgi:hypothetical protein